MSCKLVSFAQQYASANCDVHIIGYCSSDYISHGPGVSTTVVTVLYSNFM